MLIDKRYKIEKACSHDSARPALHEPYLDVPEGRLVATDGMIIAVVPVKEVDATTEISQHIPIECLKKARHLVAEKKMQPALIRSLKERLELTNGQTWRNSNLGSFPNWKTVMPQDPVSYRITLSPNKLFLLAQALGVMGDELVTLECSAPDQGVHIHVNEAHGIIMPAREDK